MPERVLSRMVTGRAELHATRHGHDDSSTVRREATIFTIEMLPAQQGDALLIEYGGARRILIDCGTPLTYDVIKERMSRLPPDQRVFELLVITHVDIDHIGGALRLLSEPTRLVTFRDVWFNSRHVLPQCPDPPRGMFDGAIAAHLLELQGITVNAAFSGAAAVVPAHGPLPRVILPGGLVLTLLSPGHDQLTALSCHWGAVLRKAGLDPLGPSMDELARRARRKGIPDLRGVGTTALQRLAAGRSGRDPSRANGSTIAFLAEYDGRSCLFAGDAHAEVIVASLRRLHDERGPTFPGIDVFKLPHHGSKYNVTAELLRAARSSTYLFSTDGTRFGHPDAEAVARVICHGGPQPRLVFNYRSPTTVPWADPGLRDAYRYEADYPASGQAGIVVRLA
jgi:beta-lactamase superfamily II metal-dependent hydrolase